MAGGGLSVDFQREVLHRLASITAEQQRHREAIDALRAALVEPFADLKPYGALNRKAAASAMSMSVSKLDHLIRTGKIRPGADPHLVPVSEVKRYCAPRAPRVRRPVIGHRARRVNVDGQSDEAWAEMKRRLREKAKRPAR